jgi:hypothetical protein
MRRLAQTILPIWLLYNAHKLLVFDNQVEIPLNKFTDLPVLNWVSVEVIHGPRGANDFKRNHGAALMIRIPF